MKHCGRGRIVRVALVATFLTLPWAGTVSAQRGGPGGRGAEREAMQERIRERFGEIVRRQLGLDRSTQQALLEAVRASERARRALLGREMELRGRLREQAEMFPRRDPPPLLDPTQAREVLREMAAIREAEIRLFREEQERLLQVLTPPQLVRFYALREDLAQRIRRLRRGPPGPGGER